MTERAHRLRVDAATYVKLRERAKIAFAAELQSVRYAWPNVDPAWLHEALADTFYREACDQKEKGRGKVIDDIPIPVQDPPSNGETEH